MKKKILAVFLSLCMAMSLLPVTALATGDGETETQTPTETSITTAETLKKAIETAQTGDTVTLDRDITITDPVVINKRITLDLNGKKISASSYIWNENDKDWSLISVREKGDLTIKGNGTLKALEDDSYAVDVMDGGSCTIENGTFVGNVHAVYVLQGKLVVNDGTFSVQQKHSDAQPYEFVLNCYDSNYKNGSAKITVYGGSFKGFNPRDCEAEGVGTNFCAPGRVVTIEEGQNEEPDTYTVNELKDGAMAVIPEKITEGSVSASLEGTFTDSTDTDDIQGSITGEEPSGTVTGSDVSVNLTTKKGNSSTASLNVATDTAKSLADNANSLTVKSDVGTVTLDKAAWNTITENAGTSPVTLTIKENKTEDAVTSWEVTAVAGGEDVFSGDNLAGDIQISVPYTATEGSTVKVYCIDNGMEDMNAKLEGDNLTWTTSHLSTFAAVTLGANDTITYTTANGVDSTSDLSTAMSGVKNGGTITLLNDIPNAKGIAVPSGKNFTVDFGGHTYTLVGPGAGSSGTTTNGFQLLEGSTITFKNGTIRIAENVKGIKRIIQNYANLTLEDMHIYAENQVGSENYALSFNCGSISFKGDTDIITSNENTIAFDVCYWEAGGYTEGVTVTFDKTYTGTINGKIIYDSTDPNRAELTIHGTGYIGAVDTSKSTTNGTSITVSGGSFGESVAEYVTDGLNYEANDNGTYTYHKTLEEALKVSDTVSSVEAAKDNTNAVTVTVKNGNDETKITLKKNDTYKLPTLSDQGYNHFQGWTDQNGKHYEGGQEVAISSNMTFTAVWSYIPPANPNYRIDIPAAEGGTVTADPAAAKAGATVTLTATPDEGYAVGTITVTDRFGDAVKVTENADGTYTFTMPNGQVTVKATFVETEEPAPAEPFPDVDENDWFYDEVVYVYENGLMNGVENNQFAPNTATNRAMLATILYRLAGEPAVSGDLPFTDVESGTWYTDAVLWAAQNGIVNGLGENTFAPMNTLTREQLVTMLYRYAEAEGYDVSAAADLSGYPDADKVQTYAQEAMSWAVAEGIVEGMDGNLNPAGSATRAQIATILMRFCEGVAK